MPERKSGTTARDEDGRLTIEDWDGAFEGDEIAALCAALIKDLKPRDQLWDDLKKIKFGKHKVDIAEEFKAIQRTEIRVPYAMNTVNNYVDGILHGGVTYKIPPRSQEPDDRKRSTDLERWVTAYMRRLEKEAPYAAVMRRAGDDVVGYGQGAAKVVLALDNWASMPQPEDLYFREVIQEDGTSKRVGKTKDNLSPKETRKYERDRQTFKNTFAKLPTAWRHVQMRNFYPLYGEEYIGGVERQWRSEYELAQKYRVYFDPQGARARDSSGKYASSGLVTDKDAIKDVLLSPPLGTAGDERGSSVTFEATSANQMSGRYAAANGPARRDRVREVWEYSDKWATYILISGKLVCRFRHGYGWAPTIHVLSRQTSDGGVEEQAVGLLRNMKDLLPAFDRRLTMNEIASERNVMNYHILTSTNPEAKRPMASDSRQPEPIRLKANEVPYASPGYTLQTAVEQVAPDNTQSLMIYQQLVTEQGVSPQAIGMPGATSGYDRNQMRQDFKISRDPFATALEDLAEASVIRAVDLFERFIPEEEIELYVAASDKQRSATRPNFYKMKGEDWEGERFILATVDPLQDADIMGKIEAGLRAWQGTGNKRGIPHRRFLEEFMEIENPDDYLQEIREEEWLDSAPVRMVLNKAAADESGITELYLEALQATETNMAAGQGAATTATGVEGRGYGSTPGQASGIRGVGDVVTPASYQETGTAPTNGQPPPGQGGGGPVQ